MSILNGLYHNNINLDYLIWKEDRSELETEMLSVSNTDGDYILEEDDFNLSEEDGYQLTKTEEKLDFDSASLLNKYKCELVKSMLFERAKYLQDYNPDLYLEEVALVLSLNSTGVNHISEMVDNLVPFLESLSKANLSAAEIKVNCMVWCNLYQYKVLQNEWITEGNVPPVLNTEGEPSQIESENFINTIMTQLEEGNLTISFMDELTSSQAYASYDHDFDTINVNLAYFSEPLLANRDSITNFGTLLHECFHAYHDYLGNQMPLAQTEMESEIFEMKAKIILYGYDALDQKQSMETLGTLMYLQEAYDTNKEYPIPVNLIIKDHLEPGNFWSNLNNFREDSLQIAYQELNNGQIQDKKRQAFQDKYVQMRIGQRFLSITNQFFEGFLEYAQTTDPKKLKRLSRKNLKEFPRKYRYKNIPEGFLDIQNPDESLFNYTLDLAAKFVLIYYKEGEESAKLFLDNYVVPSLENIQTKFFTDNIIAEFNGISEKEEELSLDEIIDQLLAS